MPQLGLFQKEKKKMTPIEIGTILVEALSNQPSMIDITLDLNEQAGMSAQTGIDALKRAGMSANEARDTYWDYIRGTGIFKK